MKRVPLLLQSTLTVAVLVVVVRRVDVHAAAAAISDASIAWIALALAMNLVAVSASTQLWATLMPARSSSYGRLWRVYVTGLFYNNLGLGTLLGDGYRYAELRRSGEHSSRTAVSVLGERLVSAGALLALAATGSLYFVRSHPVVPLLNWLAVAVAVAGAVIAWRLGPSLSGRVPLPRSFRAQIAGVGDGALDLASRPSILARGFAWACVVQACTVAATYLLMRSLAVDVSPAACFAVVPVIALAVLLPFSIQGIGVREATYVTLFGFVGVSSQQALSAAMLSYLTTLAVTAIGGACALAALRSASHAANRAGAGPVAVGQ